MVINKVMSSRWYRTTAQKNCYAVVPYNRTEKLLRGGTLSFVIAKTVIAR